jgi:hypothetical protein
MGGSGATCQLEESAVEVHDTAAARFHCVFRCLRIRFRSRFQRKAELSDLSFQHAIALRDAAFTGMTEKQAKEFDQRRTRISELSTILGKLKASDLIG